MNIFDYIMQEGLVLIPVLYIIGQVISGTETIPNKWIPLILLSVSLGFTPLALGAYTPDNISQAVLIAGATVFGDQLMKQSKKGE